MISWDCPHDPPNIFGPWFLWKLIIDERQQARGLGREVVLTVADVVRAQGGQALLVSCVDEPGGPKDFYLGLGFLRPARSTTRVRPCSAWRSEGADLQVRCRRGRPGSTLPRRRPYGPKAGGDMPVFMIERRYAELMEPTPEGVAEINEINADEDVAG